MARPLRSSRSNAWSMSAWTMPFARRDHTYRHMSHGPIVPLEKPTFLERLFGSR